MYDYLIVGAGLFGSVFSYQMNQAGKTCLVIEKENHVAGHIYTEDVEGVQVHKYGAHIFHTSDSEVWAFVNKFDDFNNFINAPIANFKGELYNLPFNMNTFYQMWGVTSPEQALERINLQKDEIKGAPQNLEEQAISMVGRDIYEKLIKGYTEKQWGRACADLPSFIIRRLPLRFTFNNNYFSDMYQGIPRKGYTNLVQNMLAGIDVVLGVNYLDNPDLWNSKAKRVVYTGPIDAFYKYSLGRLEYRTLRFEHEVLQMENYQGVAVMNFTDAETPYTRILEHKHFSFADSPKTVISREYSKEWEPGDEQYYPINDKKNQFLYENYRKLADGEENIFFGGRLAEYKYYDMWQVIRVALDFAQEILRD